MAKCSIISVSLAGDIFIENCDNEVIHCVKEIQDAKVVNCEDFDDIFYLNARC